MALVDQVATIAATRAGDLRGTREGGVVVWHGVDCAEQPVCERRFVAPVRYWTGERHATRHAASAGPLVRR